MSYFISKRLLVINTFVKILELVDLLFDKVDKTKIRNILSWSKTLWNSRYMIINFNSKNAWIGLFCYSVSSNLLWKRSIKLGNNALTKFIQDVLIGFVPLILHFRIFDWTYNWNHYRRIRVNIISLRLKNWFFWWRGEGRGER